MSNHIINVQTIKNKIDSTYHSTSIYKSVVVCHSKCEELYDALYNNDYPVSTIKTLNKFTDNNSRMLILDYVDFKNVDKILSTEDLYSINYIFFIDSKKDIESKSQHIFKNIDLNIVYL